MGGKVMTYILETGDSAVEVTVIDGVRKAEIPMKKCAHCDGDGFYLAEVPYVDYYNGGFLKEERRCCEECGGSGFTVLDNE